MEINSGNAKIISKRDRVPVLGVTDPANVYAHHNVQFYLFPPQETVSLTDLRNLALFRQKVLTAVESMGARYQKHGNDYQRELDHALRQLDFKVAITANSNLFQKEKNGIPIRDTERDKEFIPSRREDFLSHFILRLAYCGTSDLRQWFIQQEVDLFRHRFASESLESTKTFLQLYGIPTELISFGSEEYKDVEPIMKQLFPSRPAPAGSEEPDPKMDIFKVYFTEAADLIRHRKVFLRRGFAYVPYRELTSVVVGRFRSNLSRALITASKYSETIQEDVRLQWILKSITSNGASSRSAASTTEDASTTVTAEMVEPLSKESFPPCMRMAYKHLQTKHHMKHQGRMQLGLFFKGIGLSLEDSLKLWKQAFAPVVDSEKFEKQYAYNIRHNYGKEGKRADYSAYNCLRVINLPAPGPGDCHGCPFKTMDAPVLRQNLDVWGVSGENQETIVELSQSHQYDRACTRFFEHYHHVEEGSLGQLISHPNQFFEESRKLRLGQKDVNCAVSETSQVI